MGARGRRIRTAEAVGTGDGTFSIAGRTDYDGEGG